jgi:TM2 domain-containing membrane protein YozV
MNIAIAVSWGVIMTKKKVSRKPVRVKVMREVRELNWILLLLMSIFFGWIGVDRFMMGKIGTGILKLITFGGLGIWWLIDLILIATKYEFKNIEYVE